MNLKISLVLCYIFLYSKIIEAQSININGSLPYYPDVKSLNYILGTSLNAYIGPFKLETGFAYGTKNPTNGRLNYCFIPILLNRRVYTDSCNTFSISLGSVLLFPFGYSREKIEPDGAITLEKIPVKYRVGSTVRIGLQYSRRFYKNFFFFSEIYANYKVVMDYQFYSSHFDSNFYNLSDERFDIGIRLGVEWVFAKKELIYYKRANKSIANHS